VIVGIDVSAIPREPRGAGRYVIELVRALGARGTVDLRLESGRGDGARWQQLALASKVDAVVPTSRWQRLLWEQLMAPRFVDRWGVDVFHGPHYTMPERATLPKVVTIHDLTFFDHPERHEKVKVTFFTRAIKTAAQRADALICVSDHTADRLRSLLEPRCPVHVIPHGIDHAVFTPVPSPDDDQLLAALGVRPPFVAFVGTLEPRKDLVTLVGAFDRLDGDAVQLVIAGGSGWGNDAFERAVANSPSANRIVRTGFIPDATVAALFRGAAAAVYPAVDEGFGLPVIEALASGATAITTAGSVMDSLAGGTALTAAASDPAALAEVIRTALTESSSSADARRARGLDVAARFTWDATAAAHEEVYREVGRVRIR
jgi:glycosyltransferase involved in cell wall biosynthesis